MSIKEYIKQAIARARYYDETRQYREARHTRTLIRASIPLRHRAVVIDYRGRRYWGQA